MVRGLREPHLLVRETMERRKAFDGKNNTAIFFKPPHVPIGCVFFLGDDRRPQPYFETWVGAHKTFLVSGKKIKNRSPIEPMFFSCHTAPHGTAQRQKRLVLALDSRKDTRCVLYRSADGTMLFVHITGRPDAPYLSDASHASHAHALDASKPWRQIGQCTQPQKRCE